MAVSSWSLWLDIEGPLRWSPSQAPSRLGRNLTHPCERGSSFTLSTGAPCLFPPEKSRIACHQVLGCDSRPQEASNLRPLRRPSCCIHTESVPSSLYPIALASSVSKSQRCVRFERISAGFWNTLILFSSNMPRGCGAGEEGGRWSSICKCMQITSK